jgi:hypothetical protein
MIHLKIYIRVLPINSLSWRTIVIENQQQPTKRNIDEGIAALSQPVRPRGSAKDLQRQCVKDVMELNTLALGNRGPHELMRASRERLLHRT